ncbi:manganese efflux pump MntP family protein [Rhodovulum sp. DZ06]|uniref:manganese efflux pump MntP n=1 Tax=Rhodovulum sp. DZ06 TaxID=3425126 RepID=UPI003D34BD9D
MTPLSIGALALSMSMDAFVAALGKGAAARPSLPAALRTGAIFGAVEAVTPLVGWAAGVVAARHVAAVDHWIAFGLLTLVGVRMVLQAWTREDGETPRETSVRAVLATAIGTSVDAMAVGVSLAFWEVNILVVAAAIGAATMAMSSAGMLAGRFLGTRFGRIAESFGGLALCALGTSILVEHLAAG